MSHHLDTPLASQNGQLYIDDLYVFQGDGSTVFVMDVNSNITGVYAQPGFHPEARYEFKMHFDGADSEALTYRVSFAEPDPAGRQALQLHALTGGDVKCPTPIHGCGPVPASACGAPRSSPRTRAAGGRLTAPGTP